MVSSDVVRTRPDPGSPPDATAGFTQLFAEVEPKLRRALIATHGAERGRDATVEALAWAWEHRDRLGSIDSPLRYLYRVGQSRTRPRRLRVVAATHDHHEPWVEPGLPRALGRLSGRQRTVVVLAEGYGYTHGEIAELLGVSPSSVQTHLERGLRRLRSDLEDRA